jgi:AcrR family transcriptional regulator
MNLDSPGTLRQRHRETTREVILDAAEAAFSKDGLSRARIEDVAATAGVAVGTIYNHFADRQALVGALLERRREEALSRVDGTLAELGHAPFAARLEAVLTTLMTHFDAHQMFYSLLLEEEVRRDASSRYSSLAAVVGRLEKLVAAGVAEGALREEDAELYPSLLAGMIRGLFSHALRARKGAALVGRVKPVVRLFMEGAAP